MRHLLAVPLLLAALSGPALADPARTIIVMDGSGSMWGQIDGQPKLQAARRAVADVVGGLPASQEIGVLAYGHRVKGDCSDIELLVPPAPGNAEAVIGAVNAMRFQGKTPLTEAVRMAAEALRSDENPASVVLVTDGLETCGSDPCALARELEASGVDFTAHVIGFGLSAAEGAQVACIAQETGGRYIEASDAGALSGALRSVVGDAASVTPEPPPEPAPVAAARHFPGAWFMPQARLAPTGRTFLPSRRLPRWRFRPTARPRSVRPPAPPMPCAGPGNTSPPAAVSWPRRVAGCSDRTWSLP